MAFKGRMAWLHLWESKEFLHQGIELHSIQSFESNHTGDGLDGCIQKGLVWPAIFLFNFVSSLALVS